MFDNIISFLIARMPQRDEGVDPKDILNVVRPRCDYDPLARRAMGGWGETIMMLVRDAHNDPKSWTVNEYGDLFFEEKLRKSIIAEFRNRKLVVDPQWVAMVERESSGRIDYCTTMAVKFWAMENHMNDATAAGSKHFVAAFA
jgi:hypothetical protein